MAPASLALMRAALLEFDAQLLRKLHGRRKERLNRFMMRVTHLGDPLGWAALTGGLWLSGPAGRRLVRDVTPATAATVGVAYALKVAFGRPRPAAGIDNVEALVRFPDRYSFPSGHAATTTAAAVRAAQSSLRAGGPFGLMAGLISFSRIYVGVHYPLDVVAGAAVGAATALTEPAWAAAARVTGRSGARAIRAAWLRARAADRGLPPADRPPPRAWADR